MTSRPDEDQAPSWDDDARALARIIKTRDLTALGALYVRRGGNPMIGRYLCGKKIHGGRGKSEAKQRELDRKADAINAYLAEKTPDTTGAKDWTLIVNIADDFGVDPEKLVEWVNRRNWPLWKRAESRREAKKKSS